MIHVVRGLGKAFKSKNLCFTGGVALNCVANGRVRSETDYAQVWIPPCASDTGVPSAARFGTTTKRLVTLGPLL